MSYNKYYIYKEQISFDNGATWQDTGQATPSGDPIGTYSTLGECEGVVPPTPYEEQYFTIVPRESGSIKFKISSANTSYQYSTNSGATWVTGNSATTIAATSGNKIMFKGELVSTNWSGIGRFNVENSTLKYDVEGNILSLIYGDNFRNKTLISDDYQFAILFYFETKLISAENLILPSTTLVQRCYERMFYQCSSLTKAPELPATTLAPYCYNFMFEGCSSLTKAPELPATALVDVCYYGMFDSCSSLTKAPELSATTLAPYCYEYMFNGCTSLNYIKCLATDISASDCTYNWVESVPSTGTFVTPSSTNWLSGASGIPAGWTRVNA